MRKAFWVAALCLASVALADKNVGSYLKFKLETYTVANTLATNVAALTGTSGIDLNSTGAINATACAEATRTISSGNLRAYVFMPVGETNTDGGTMPPMLWIPYPALDWTPTTGNRCAVSGDKVNFVGGISRLAWVEDDIAVSAGTTVVVTYGRRLGQATFPQ